MQKFIPNSLQLEHEALVKGLASGALLFLLGLAFRHARSAPVQLRKSKLFMALKDHWHDVKFLSPYVKSNDKAETQYLLALSLKGAACIAIGRLSHVLSPLMFRSILDQLNTPQGRQGQMPWLLIIGYVALKHEIDSLVSSIQWVIHMRVENLFTDRIMKGVYKKVMDLSGDYHDNKSSSGVWLTIMDSGKTVGSHASYVCFDLLPNILDLLSAFITIGKFCGPNLMVTMFLSIAVYITVVTWITDNDSANYKVWKQASIQRNETTNDAVSNWWTIYLFGRVADETTRHNEATGELRELHANWAESKVLRSMSKQTVTATAYLLLYLVLCHHIWHTPGRTGGDLTLIPNLWGQAANQLLGMLKVKERIEGFSIDAKQLLDILREEPSVKDRVDAQPFKLQNGSIKLRNISFSYPKKSQDSIRDISLDIEGGKTLAIVGESGGGKSTLLKLLMRGYELNCGTLSIDDQDLQDLQKASILSHMSIVPQTIGVFNTTVLNNLRYANPTATLTQCQEACRAVGLHDKITTTFDEGYDTIIGERGAKLSGGELQRLAIARVLLRDTQIVLLDEATSNLDSETEFKIQEHLRRWCQGRTVVIVAHRLASIAHADRIVAVREGRIVELGTHAELLARKGYFSELWGRQKLA